MRGVFGLVSLLVVLAIVGLLAARQLKGVNASLAGVAAIPAAQGVPALPGMASAPLTGNVREQSQQIQKQVADEMSKAMAAGARKDESGQ